MRKGRDLELIVAHIERLLGHGTATRCASPGFLNDKVTGKSREFDVLLTYEGHHSLIVGIDCKDWAVAVGTPEVEGFVSKCHDCGVSRGILVSRSGYAESALIKARAHNVQCLNLADALGFQWLQTNGIDVYQRKMHAVNIVPLVEDEKIRAAATIGNVTLLDPSGREITSQFAANLMSTVINQFRPAETETPGELYVEQIRVRLEPPFTMRVTGYDEPIAVDLLAVRVQYTMELKTIPLTMLSYEQSESGEVISETAYADHKVGDLEGRVTLVHKPGEGAKLFITPGSALELGAALSPHRLKLPAPS